MASPARSTAELGRVAFPLTDVQRAVLLTVLYADLFDFPLTESEIVKRLLLHRADAASVRGAIGSLMGPFLTASGPFITWRGREQLIDLRRRRSAVSHELWRDAERYSSWISRIPFIRMVAVSGSLAADNAEGDSDIDVFCITESDRLWLVRLFIVPLSTMTRRFPRLFPRYLCPNYIVAANALEIEDRNAYTAHEIALSRPIYGARMHAEFMAANEWVHGFLPQWPLPNPPELCQAAPIAARWFERVFSGSMGDRLDLAAFAAFRTFYRRRAERRGWSWERLQRAYGRRRYTVPEGGYAGVVRRLFDQLVQERVGPIIPVHSLFPNEPPSKSAGATDWEAHFRRDYGKAAPDPLRRRRSFSGTTSEAGR